MSRVGKGVMEVSINDTDYTLKATVFAIEAIEQRFGGGMVAAAQACMKLSFTDAAFIIGKAANLSKDAQKQLKENIVSEGIEAVSGIAADYLQMLLNPDGAPEDDGEPSGE
jgi:membrane protease subunit (stomatin/prohibitin family)